MSSQEMLFGGYRPFGKTNAMIQAFKDSAHTEMSIFCGNKESARSLQKRIVDTFKLQAEVVECTNYGRPIVTVYDELFSDNPRIEVRPNMTKSYSVKVTKSATAL